MERLALLAVFVLPFTGLCNVVPAAQHHLYRANCTSDTYVHTGWPQPGLKTALYGTGFAQATIREHQFPKAGCHGDDGGLLHNILLYDFFGAGIGAQIHRLADALAAAIQLNRILVVKESSKTGYFDPYWCNGTFSIFECYFEKLSGCNPALIDARQAATFDMQAGDQSQHRILQYSHDINVKLGILFPDLLRTFLQASPVIQSEYRLWWKTQVTAFVIRPNEKTRNAIQQRLHDHVKRFGDSVPDGTITMHVRRSDKKYEVKLLTNDAYLQAAESLITEHPDMLRRHIYLLTEDERTLQEFINLPGWNVSYFHMDRLNETAQTPYSVLHRVGIANEVLNELCNLQLAIQGDAFVLTSYFSNWSRLIDELRSTVGGKAAVPYADPGIGHTEWVG